MKWRGNKYIEKVVDAAFVFKSPIGLERSLIIIHGASCAGKSTVIKRLRRRYSGFTFVETDRFNYLVREKPETYFAILETVYKSLTDAGVDRENSQSLVESIRSFASLPGVIHPPYKTMAGLVEECLKSDVLIATCGNLPPPYWEGDFYRLLTDCTGKMVLHVLIAPDEATYMKRVQSRGMETKMKDLAPTNSWRLENKGEYQLVLTGEEPTKIIMALIRASIHNDGAALPASA